VKARLIDCPKLVDDQLRAAASATAAPEPDRGFGGWVNFGQQTEAGRLSENRDKRLVDRLYQRCHEENERINLAPERSRILGIF
jgi:hypothetical protein